jgi:hypothetical protein
VSESPESRRARLRWVTLGEAIAIAALILSGIGLWHEWNKPDGKELVVEKQRAIPLVLRGSVTNEGRILAISPVEDSHALESLTIAAGKSTIELSGDGKLDADSVEALAGKPGGGAKGTQRLPVRITAKYVEAGADKTATGTYVIRYEWEGGGLFGGRHVRLTGFSR